MPKNPTMLIQNRNVLTVDMDAKDKHFYQEQYIEYLHNTPMYRCADEQMIQDAVIYTETELLVLIQTNSGISHDEVYEYLDKETIKGLLIDLLPNNRLGELNVASDGKLRERLQLYLGFVNSKYHPLSEKQQKQRKKQKKETAPSNPSIPEPAEYDKQEGAKHESTVTRYERDRSNRKDCIAHYGYVCQVCGLNFEKAYGELGKAFIEVHHLHPVSQGERQVNPIEDLIPLCSNCHSMIHRQEDVSDWRGLKERYLANKQSHQEDGEKS